MVGIFGNPHQTPQSTSSLNLSQTGAPFGQQHQQQFGFGQQPVAQGFVAGLGS